MSPQPARATAAQICLDMKRSYKNGLDIAVSARRCGPAVGWAKYTGCVTVQLQQRRHVTVLLPGLRRSAVAAGDVVFRRLLCRVREHFVTLLVLDQLPRIHECRVIRQARR